MIRLSNKYNKLVRCDSNIENAVNVPKAETSYNVIFDEKSVIEVVYCYDKLFDIKTEIKNSESTPGGTISGEGEDSYDTVIRGQDSNKQIEIIPARGYEIKEITIIRGTEESKVDLSAIIMENGNAQLNLKDIRNDVKVIAEFKKKNYQLFIIYKDIDTNEILEQECIDTYIDKTYTANEKSFDNK
mgnify:CR=1 FL=1